MVDVPQQVLDAEAEAERIQGEIAVPDDPENPQAPAPVEDPAPAPQVPAPDAPPETPPPAESEATWEARYKTLQGMFKAEVPRLRSEVARLTDELSTASRKLAQRVEPPAPAPQAPATPPSSKDTEDFGGDLVEMVRRQAVDAARAEFGSEITRLTDLNKDLEAKLNGVADVQVASAQDRYMDDLGKKVPDYQAINDDPLFLAWLDQEDVLSGVKRQEFFSRAYRGLDVDRTAKLMLAFKDSLRTEPVVTPTPVEPAPSTPTPTERLERQVQPVPTKANNPPAVPTTGKVYSMTEIETFYREVTQGVYRGREAEQARIEADIDAAVLEGRLK